MKETNSKETIKTITALIILAVAINVWFHKTINAQKTAKTVQKQEESFEKNDFLKQKILYDAGSNYLESVFYGGHIVRWNKSKFPIKVYAQDSPDIPNYYIEAFTYAAKVWEEESGGIIKIIIVDNENDADIVFKTNDREEQLDEIRPDETYRLAYTRPYFKGDNLVKAEIVFFKKDLKGRGIQPYEALNIAVHEFGHALGIWGHSDDPKSVMYAFYNPKHKKQNSFLNKQDKATLKLLYMITPDYTNGDKRDEKDTIKSSILVGTKNDRMDTSIQKAKEEAQKKKGDCSSRLNIAILYEQKGDYEAMYEYIKEAEKLAKTKDELYAVNIAYASYYYQKRDSKNAKLYTQRALEIKETKEARDFLNSINIL